MEIKIEEDIYLNLYKKWLNCVKVVTVQNGENGKNKTPLSGVDIWPTSWEARVP